MLVGMGYKAYDWDGHVDWEDDEYALLSSHAAYTTLFTNLVRWCHHVIGKSKRNF
ncbi:hypothetical protein HO173_013063 [Letharia columbiana]|uniref:Uncharacterized protein n=1 Tax=Letharia columbiana TaxID=112416 RepID=A0A8H6CIC3_9LECA|nr:uncharacterized protein HO173_013063 [Letharia columbiana]KAF6223900.1 hypothetical protein HO173_013063 [Letharia columbiana]